MTLVAMKKDKETGVISERRILDYAHNNNNSEIDFSQYSDLLVLHPMNSAKSRYLTVEEISQMREREERRLMEIDEKERGASMGGNAELNSLMQVLVQGMGFGGGAANQQQGGR